MIGGEGRDVIGVITLNVAIFAGCIAARIRVARRERRKRKR